MAHKIVCLLSSLGLALAFAGCGKRGTVSIDIDAGDQGEATIDAEAPRPDPGPTPVGPYVQPAPAQLDPPPNYRLRPDTPLVAFQPARDVVEIQVFGHAYRPIQAIAEGDEGERSIALLVGPDRRVEVAAAGFHAIIAGAANSAGDIMVCWNTLNGATSEYSPDTPDPARGMTLRCRLVHRDESLGPEHQIRVPTVGCWIRKVVPLRDDTFRLLYKGDDGWFEARADRDTHGVHEARFDGAAWSTPRLIVPVPDPAATEATTERIFVHPPAAAP